MCKGLKAFLISYFTIKISNSANDSARSKVIKTWRVETREWFSDGGKFGFVMVEREGNGLD